MTLQETEDEINRLLRAGASNDILNLQALVGDRWKGGVYEMDLLGDFQRQIKLRIIAPLGESK